MEALSTNFVETEYFLSSIATHACTVAAKKGDIFVPSAPSRGHHIVHASSSISVHMHARTIGNNGRGLPTCKNGKPVHLSAN